MRKGNRNFCEEPSVDVGDGYINYDRMDVNIFEVYNCNSLKLQDLDLNFAKELSKNPSRFSIIESFPRKKKIIKNFSWLAIVSVVLYLISVFVSKYAKDIVLMVVGSDPNVVISTFDLNASVSVLQYVMSQFQLFLNVFALFLLFLFIIGVCVVKPFFKLNNGKRFVLILDEVGFYKVDIDITDFQDNNLADLYFVQFVESQINQSLAGCVKSVSYFSSYCRTMSDSKYYVLDLPNDSITYSNEYDLEFCRKDFRNKDFKKLVNYLDDSEDGDDD